jgi:hypothetical protein
MTNHMGEESKLIDELLDNLIQSPTRPEEIQVCPICGGKLHVGLGLIKDLGKVCLERTCNVNPAALV